jgi:hypothetical protein
MERIVLTCDVPVYKRVKSSVLRTGGWRARGEFVPIGKILEVEFNGMTRLALPLLGDNEGKFLLVEDLDDPFGELCSQWSSRWRRAGLDINEQQREHARGLADECKTQILALLKELAPAPLRVVS